MTDEVSVSENIREVLKIERQIEGGCDVLLDKEQAIVRGGKANDVTVMFMFTIMPTWLCAVRCHGAGLKTAWSCSGLTVVWPRVAWRLWAGQVVG